MESWRRNCLMVLCFSLAVAVVSANKDPADPPASSDSCGDVLVSLLPCAPAIGKDAEKPSEACCSAIKAVSPTCICFLLSTKPDIPDPLKDINFDAIAKIPKACGLKAHYVAH